jgi:hypothetical protein
VAHRLEGVFVGVESATIQARPRRHTNAREPLLEPDIAPLTFQRVDRVEIEAARLGDRLSSGVVDDFQFSGHWFNPLMIFCLGQA